MQKYLTLAVLIVFSYSLYSQNLYTLTESSGANGDDANDDSYSIQHALNNNYYVSFLPGKHYYIANTIIIPANKTLYIPGGTILEYTANNIAITMAENSTLRGEGTLLAPSPWNVNVRRTGICLMGSYVKVNLAMLSGFDNGIDMGGTYQINNCDLKINYFYDILRGFYIHPEGSGSVSNNKIHTGQMGEHRTCHTCFPLSSETSNWQTYSVGVDMRNEPINNTFSGHIEGYTTGIRLSGAYNAIQSLRLENCKTRIELAGITTRKNYLYGEWGELSNIEITHQTNTGNTIVNLTNKTLYETLLIYGWDNYTNINYIKVSEQNLLSDIRIKENIESIETLSARNKINAMHGVHYNFKNDSLKQKKYGFIAQEFKQVIPELVACNPFDSLFAINYEAVLPILVEALKFQEQEIIDCNEAIQKLWQTNAALNQLLKNKSNIPDKSITSIINLGQNIELVAYPNPTAGNVHIVSPDKIKSYQLIDVSGKTYLNNTVTETEELKLNFENFPDGLYLLQISTISQTYTIKLLLDK